MAEYRGNSPISLAVSTVLAIVLVGTSLIVFGGLAALLFGVAFFHGSAISLMVAFAHNTTVNPLVKKYIVPKGWTYHDTHIVKDKNNTRRS